MSAADAESDLREHVVDALLALANVGYGDLDSRVDVRVPLDSPLGALLTGINEMIDALRAERARSSAYRSELEDKLATIEAQRAAIHRLSTPLIEVWEGVLCLPIVGDVDPAHAAQISAVLLPALAATRCRCAIVDITGITAIDAGTVEQFVRIARAVRLLGATYVLTGVTPATARALIAAGVDLGEIKVCRSLRDALREHIAGESPR